MFFITGNDTWLFYDTPLRTNFDDVTEFYDGDTIKLRLKFRPIEPENKEIFEINADVLFCKIVSQQRKFDKGLQCV